MATKKKNVKVGDMKPAKDAKGGAGRRQTASRTTASRATAGKTTAGRTLQ